jgi:NADPH:quinone reductase-like Zn-dependent oxidoreductase
VRVQALSINALDLLVVKGIIPVQLPHLPICDAAGTMEALLTKTKYPVAPLLATRGVSFW